LLVVIHISTHELADNLSRGFVFSTASFKKFFAQSALNPDSKTDVFHG